MVAQGRFRGVAVVAGVVLLVGVLGLLYIFFAPNEDLGGRGVSVFVSRGATFSAITDSLTSKGIIRSKFLFQIVARLSGGTERLQIGKYVFTGEMSNAAVLQHLLSGEGSQMIQVTLPEGLRSRAQAVILARALGIDTTRYLTLSRDPVFTHGCGIEAGTLEGYLFPDTYFFSWQQDERDILHRQVAEFRRFFTDSLRARAEEMGWTMHQVVTFASIVEGEAVLDEERPVIAGVYLNRLRKGMKLEADPTIQFILPDGPRRVLYADLRRDSPYNTYLYAGLPPGPVNNPGRQCITASLYPAQHGYVFFVANGHGGHRFARTYAEHLRNVSQYRRNRVRLSGNAQGLTDS